MLKLYNTLTKKKEIFVPLNSNKVTMYVCGPTVYNDIHIGNARPIVVFDTLFKLLQTIYEEVVYVRNITDVDDKIIIKAKENNESITNLTQRMILSFHEDIGHLNVATPTFEPKATEHINEIIALIQKLLINNYAYIVQDHVFFAVEKFKDYGHLSNLTLEELIAGQRVEVNPLKRNSADFVLWKPSAEAEIGWDSPWGFGRPGWHIECSAMSYHFLGENFDIHGGGKDLIFPHHENERAQSMCAFLHSHFANYWLHNGFLTIEGEKMAKSLGNFITLKQALSDYDGETIRLTLLRTHYKQPLDFKKSSLEQSRVILKKIYTILKEYNISLGTINYNVSNLPIEFKNALYDDLNTHKAISFLQESCFSLEQEKKPDSIKAELQQIISMGYILGILQNNPIKWLENNKKGTTLKTEQIEKFIKERQLAKNNKDYQKADDIRNYLQEHNIELEDNKNGETTWKII